MRVALIAPKNTGKEPAWLASFFPFPVEEYRRHRLYDAVIFFNLTDEVRRIKAKTTTRVCTVNPEPKHLWGCNYDPDLLRLCDFYSAYKDFSDARFHGVFNKFVFFADSEPTIRTVFRSSMAAERTTDFLLFAAHDPNIRRRIGEAIGRHKAILEGPLFNRPFILKPAVQRLCRFEFITENSINDWYMTEKVPQSLMAGCVPVYYGCTRAAEVLDPALFIDMHDFGNPEVPGVLDAIVRHCLAPGTYETYFDRIRRTGEHILAEKFSLEKTMVAPISHFILKQAAEGFRPRRKWFWRR